MKKAAFVASVYQHFRSFHLPYMALLQRNGYEVHAFAQADDARMAVAEAGVICHDIPIRRSPFSFDNWRALRNLTTVFRAEGFELVHMHTPVAGVLGRLAAKRAGVGKVLYTAHGFHFYKGAPLLNWLVYYPLEHMMARLTDHLITINEEDYERAIRFPVRGAVHDVAGVGLSIANFQVEDRDAVRRQLRTSLGIAEDDFVIVCIAEINANKNQQQLVEAVQLLKQRGTAVKCLLVGRGERQEEIRELVRAKGLEAEVLFLGQRSDIAEILAAGDVCTLVSLREGLPRSLMEAMAASLPIVATRVRGSRNLVRHEVSGFLVTPGDAAETADAFALLAAAPELRLAMGQQGRRLAQAFDISTILEEIGKIYLGNKRDRSGRELGDLRSEPTRTRAKESGEPEVEEALSGRGSGII